ncbi:hypothetical protein AMS68_005315 [Peltaster fructicola]|uniref:IgE-binding protein n=1 Tax=Peltaster fructicola TaxID=286661 RepID=A0A6H0XYX5_9PEZI|nr:hypothetical protein AMS68_005315 [Peltaster fructicola]
MKTAAAILALAGAVTAQNYMRVMSIRSGSPIMYAPMVARGEKIYLGGETASYCPETVGENCPAGNTTTFVYGQGHLSMGAIVPGGQAVYVDSQTGAVGYTIAHSAAIPQGAYQAGWNVTQNVAAGGILGRLDFEGGLIACPVDGTYPYQVFGQVEGVSFAADCLALMRCSATALRHQHGSIPKSSDFDEKHVQLA